MSSTPSRAVRNSTGVRWPDAAQPLRHLEAVEVGQHHVEHDEVGRVLSTAASASRPFSALETSNPS